MYSPYTISQIGFMKTAFQTKSMCKQTMFGVWNPVQKPIQKGDIHETPSRFRLLPTDFVKNIRNLTFGCRILQRLLVRKPFCKTSTESTGFQPIQLIELMFLITDRCFSQDQPTYSNRFFSERIPCDSAMTSAAQRQYRIL